MICIQETEREDRVYRTTLAYLKMHVCPNFAEHGEDWKNVKEKKHGMFTTNTNILKHVFHTGKPTKGNKKTNLCKKFMKADAGRYMAVLAFKKMKEKGLPVGRPKST